MSHEHLACEADWLVYFLSGGQQQPQTYVNGYVNNIVDVGQVLVQQQPQYLQQQGVVQGNLITMCKF